MKRIAPGIVAVVLLSALSPRPSAAQSSAEVPKVVRYGKWGATAMFAIFTTAGVIAHNNADASYRSLQQYCLSQGSCSIGPDGRYSNPAAESRYQDVVRGDRSARAWLISGQIALGGAAALFVIDLLHDHGTRNIPYNGYVAAGRFGATNLGVRLSF